ncbi:phage-like protein [Clostridium botulinum]|uniref:phage-like protein n=1 Tax=Clostridium botulinum TaxID=1491 RepID=UPI0004D3BD91|nr:phage-like protein [Clostridium botulinum]KEH96473.1 putative phage-related protein [Clostridium botulinum D str. 16868]
MANLQQVNENFILVGEARINKDLDRYVKVEPLGKNGWMKKRLNLGVKISDTNNIYVGLEAGFWSDEAIERTKNETGKDERGKNKKKQNWIYRSDKQEDGSNKTTKIPFDKRFDEELVETIPYFNKITVALENETANVNGDNGELKKQIKIDSNENPMLIQKVFIFAGDAIDYIQKHLKNGQKIYVYGHTEINQYVNKMGELKTNFNRVIDQIRLARKDEENQAIGTTNFYMTKDSFDKSDFKHSRKYYIQGHRTYKREDKVVVPVPVTYILDFSNPKVNWEDEAIKERVDYLTGVFTENIKRDKVYRTSWRYMIFEGNSETELIEKDLSNDLKKRVKLGFITLEQAIKQMRGSSIGTKIKELRLVMPVGEEDKTLMEEYEIEDLVPPVIENKVNEVEEKAKQEEEEKQEQVKQDITAQFDAMFK